MSASVKRISFPGTFVPRGDPFVDWPDRRQAPGAELTVDTVPEQVVDDQHVMGEAGEMEGGGPSAETLSPPSTRIFISVRPVAGRQSHEVAPEKQYVRFQLPVAAPLSSAPREAGWPLVYALFSTSARERGRRRACLPVVLVHQSYSCRPRPGSGLSGPNAGAGRRHGPRPPSVGRSIGRGVFGRVWKCRTGGRTPFRRIRLRRA